MLAGGLRRNNSTRLRRSYRSVVGARGSEDGYQKDGKLWLWRWIRNHWRGVLFKTLLLVLLVAAAGSYQGRRLKLRGGRHLPGQKHTPPVTAAVVADGGGSPSQARGTQSKELLQVLKVGGATLCRVYGACLLSNGLWSIEGSLEEGEARTYLDACGIVTERTQFIDALEQQGGVYEAVDVIDVVVRKGRMLQGDNVYVIAILDMLSRWKELNASEACYGSKAAQAPCSVQKLDSIVFLDQEILGADPSDWRASLAGMLASGGMPLAFRSQQEYADRTPICFRSVLASSIVQDGIPGQLLSESNSFFKSKGLSRRRVVDDHPKDERPCRIRIRILQPRHSDLHFEALSKVLTAVTDYMSRARNQTELIMDMQVEHMSTDNKIEEDIAMMQQTDVLVVPHWEYNSAIMFLRPGAVILELFQFGLHSALFQRLAETMGLEYSAVSSLPDKDGFSTCLRNKGIAEDRLVGMLKAFDEESKDRFVRAQLESFAAFRSSKLEDLVATKCLEQQRLLLSTPFLFKFLFFQTESLCHFPQRVKSNTNNAHSAS